MVPGFYLLPPRPLFFQVAVDHQETLESIKGVCSPKYIKMQMKVK